MSDMSIFTKRPALRWAVPAAITVAVIGGGAAAQTLVASAEPALPPRSAQQLLVDLQTAKLDGLSGTVVQTSDLGLPQLPGIAGGFASLVSGSHTMRVWYSGPDKARIALLGTLGEHDMIRNGRDVWTWNSRSNSATHKVLPEGAPDLALNPADLPKTPQEMADLILRYIQPSTTVTTGSNAKVAGRSAYELILNPKDPASLVGEISLAIDGEHHVPLRVKVYPRSGGAPAIEIAFTQVNFARPDDAQFRFNPPAGTKVEEESAGAPRQGAPADKPDLPDGTKVVGTGWGSVVVAKAPGAGGDGGQLLALLDVLPKVSGPWGSGRLFSSRLFTVLLTDNGRVLAGFVTPERLYQVAGE
jgi:outer membrane lipoprotein-sorting protein